MAVGTRGEAGAAHPTHTWWNFTVLGADIAFFSLGLSISSAYTMMPLFVHHLTSDNVLVALIPAIRALGLFGPQLLVAPMVERRRHALPFILVLTTLERVPYLILGLGALWLAQSNATLLLVLFFVMVFLALFGGGLTYPAWLDMIARAIPGNWLGRFLGFWTGVGGILGIGGAAVTAILLARVGWPANFAFCFILTFATMAVSFVLLSLGREPPRALHSRPVPDHLASGAENGPGQGATSGLGRQARELWELVRGDAGLRRLLISNGLVGISTMAGALFAVSALKIGGLTDPQVAVESTVLFIAMTVGYFLWGAVGDRFGHRAILVFGSVGAAGSALAALWAYGFWAYAAIFLLLGFNISAISMAGFTLISEFGPESRRPTYVALASVSYAPFAILAPLIGGVLSDHWGYFPVFIISAIAGAVAVLAFQFWVPDPRARRSAASVGNTSDTVTL
ncbi:MAG: MFS transporter [Ktedonobacterales bacterium]